MAAVLASIARNEANRMYHIELSDKSVLRFPYVWLRDNCRCADCFDLSSRYRTCRVIKLDADIVPVSEEIANDGKTLQIKWPGLHTSCYPVSWLVQMRFSESAPEWIDPYRYPKHLWGAEMKDKIPTFQYDDIMNSDQTLYDWLQAVVTYGLSVIKKAPTECNTIDKLGNRVFFLKQTHYGKVSQLVCLADNTNLGFTTRDLALHVDLPYLEHSPGIEILHCVQQSEVGGDNQYTDVFNCAEKLQQSHPEYYKILTTTLVDFRDWGVPKEKVTHNYDDHHLKYRKPILELTRDGKQLKNINYSDALRAPYFRIPVDEVHGWYKAYTALNALMYSPENMINVKLNSGEIACIDNQRLVHGRTAYKMSEVGKSRHMALGYIDWDQATSRMRVIRERQGEDPI
ncbi:gamma-butyrobetaine dioxygenase-like [Amphiura filiformis]|uniref:gamma-butyrobetaine dioxygenase-like n=1 Tax=Amphiura filiformis TaxID=82378 RepID=UPI003B21EB8A